MSWPSRKAMQPLLCLAAVAEPDLGVLDRVERKAASSASRSAAGRVRIWAASVTPPSDHTASAIWRARNVGSPRAVDPGRQLVGGRPEMPGRGSLVTRRC